MAKGDTTTVGKDAGHGYWMYKDGYSYWGIGLYRNFERPLKTTEELHRGEIEAKVKWHNETSKQIEADAKAKAEKEKRA